MELQFIKANPSGNTTVFILDKVPRAFHAEIAAKVMDAAFIGAEQVGFLEEGTDQRALARLQMAGNEFCGNASRSFAAFLALGGLSGTDLKLFSEEEKEIIIEASGHQGILKAKIGNLGSQYLCRAEIEMPLPLELQEGREETLGDYSLVVFEGIIHVILWEKIASAEMIAKVRSLLERKKLPVDCFGALFYDSATSRMIPVVHVEALDSTVWESSCGSGSIALAAAVSHREKRSIDNYVIHQPGGDLVVSVTFDGGITKASLSGEVSFPVRGTLQI